MTQPGICPFCGSDNIDFAAQELTEVGIYYPCTCNDCGKIFQEHYNLEFSDMYDEQGQRIDDDYIEEDEEEPTLLEKIEGPIYEKGMTVLDGNYIVTGYKYYISEVTDTGIYITNDNMVEPLFLTFEDIKAEGWEVITV